MNVTIKSLDCLDCTSNYCILDVKYVFGRIYDSQSCRSFDIHEGVYGINQGDLALNSGNYDLSYQGNNLTITKALLNVIADAKTKVYGDADPALTYQVSGLKNGDTAGAVLNGGSLSRVGITAMRRSHFPRPEQSFLQGQIELAYAVDFIDTRLYDDMRRRLDAAADSRWAELRSTNT